MNENEIRNMEAGCTMDALVAERVMGWRYSPGWECHIPPEQIAMPDEMWTDWQHDAGEFWKEPIKEHHVSGIVYSGDFSKIIMPQWSRDIAAAWEVVEKMAELIGPISVAWGSFGTEGNMASVMALVGIPPGVVAPTAPLAICRAALLAVMERDE